MMTKTYMQNGKHPVEWYVITDRVFMVNGSRFEVTGTRITGRGPMDSTHDVKGPGGVKEMTHKQLIAVWLKHVK